LISFVVYGEPTAQGRPRFTTVAGHAKAYDPAKSRDYKQLVRLAAVEVKPEKPLECALSLVVSVYRSMPKMSKKKREQAIAGDLRPTTRPDLDNIIKGIKDALKGIIWRDDSQVVNILADKWYGESPRVEVTIEEIVQ
jgi:Holliday junction resolvase RusA-like endonuclease